jgi:HK97 family phage major capsid protein
MTPKERYDKRASLVKDMRALLDAAPATGLTAEDQTKYDKMEQEVDKLTAAINREEKLATVETVLRNQRDNAYRPAGGEGEVERPRNTKAFKEAFWAYIRKGLNGVFPEMRNALEIGTPAEGGYIVPESFATAIIQALVALDPIRAAAQTIVTASDRHFPLETGKGTFGYIDEEGQYQKSDPALGRVTIGAFKSGGIILVSEELLQDTFVDLPAYLVDVASRRYNDLEAAKFCLGTGTAQPQGLFFVPSVGGINLAGVTGAVSATPVITGDNLIDTFHALGQAYRRRASWLTSDTMIKMVRKLKNTVTGDYIWMPGLTAGQPDTILGRPVLVSEGAPVPAVDIKSIMLGDFSRYLITERLGLQVQRLSELYAENGQIGFKFTKRNDARLVDPRAFVYFKHGDDS